MESPKLYAFEPEHSPYYENLNNALVAIVELVEEVNALKAKVAALEAAAPKTAGRK